MKISEYLIEEQESLFDSGYPYPEFLSNAIENQIEDIALYDYGNREIRPYLISLTERGEISPELSTVIQNAVYSYIIRNSYKYEGLFESEEITYDPIENYSMTEIMTDDTTEIEYGRTDTRTLEKDSSDSRTLNLSECRDVDVTDTRTANLTDTHTLDNLTSTDTEQIAGFNSSGFSDANKKTTVGTGSETTATTGTDTNRQVGSEDTTHTGTDVTAYTGTDTDTNVQSGTDTHTRNYTLTRSGNIGVTTSEQMIMSFREVSNFSAVTELAHGIINAITIGVY